MADRIMYVQLKTGYDLDGGPVLDLPRPLLQDLADGVLPRANPAPIAGLLDANFYDVETKEEFWVSGPKRDGTDGLYGGAVPEVDEDVREAYEAFLRCMTLPGRERG